MRSLRSLAALAVCALLVVPAGADEPALPTRPLTHDEALRLAAARNVGMLANALEVASATESAESAWRGYVPAVELDGTLREVPDRELTSVSLTPRILYTSPVGTGVRVEGTYTEGIGANPQTARSMTIEVTQALLRGGFHLGLDPALRAAELDVAIARERYREELNAFLTSVDRAYWELGYAAEDLEIKRRSRDRARDQLEETRENIRRGLLAPGEVFVVEESFAEFETAVSRAEETLALAEVALARLIRWKERGAPRPSSAIDAGSARDMSEADAVALAVQKRPSVVAARLSVRRSGASVDVERRGTLPKLDAFGSVGVATGTEATNAGLDGIPDLRTGLRFSIPLDWGPDSARLERARIEERRQRLELEDAEEGATLEVKQASIRLAARARRLELVSRVVDLSQKKLEVERDKYKSGLSTLADVVRFQRELDGALSASLRARVDVLEARTELAAARGDLHERLGIRVE